MIIADKDILINDHVLNNYNLKLQNTKIKGNIQIIIRIKPPKLEDSPFELDE